MIVRTDFHPTFGLRHILCGIKLLRLQACDAFTVLKFYIPPIHRQDGHISPYTGGDLRSKVMAYYSREPERAGDK